MRATFQLRVDFVQKSLAYFAMSDSATLMRFAMEAIDDGRLNHDQGQFLYSFRLNEAVPADHPIRQIASVLELSWGCTRSWRRSMRTLASLRLIRSGLSLKQSPLFFILRFGDFAARQAFFEDMGRLIFAADKTAHRRIQCRHAKHCRDDYKQSPEPHDTPPLCGEGLTPIRTGGL